MTPVEVFVPLSQLPTGSAKEGCGPETALWTFAATEAARRSGIPKPQAVLLVRKSLDARKGFPLGFRLGLEVFAPGQPPPSASLRLDLPGHDGDWAFLQGNLPRMPSPQRVLGRKKVAIIGTGPAGTFCADRLNQAGAEVVLIEQGQPVQPRRHDIAKLLRGALSPESNYCFGEGGAGTFSDGKLYTRCKDKEAVGETVWTLVHHGADPQISFESRPHIGSNKWPKVLLALRADLEARGVTYHFGQKLVDLLRAPSGKLLGVRCEAGLQEQVDAVVLAVGHSARTVYELLAAQNILLQRKDFAIGSRIEHPQALIDKIQYGRAAQHPVLPAAFYQIASSVADRGVYSFCMCPGGWIVPSATESAGLCVNGMSLKRRDSPRANSALVVTVRASDVERFGRFENDPLAGIYFQRTIEERAFAEGGGAFWAPAQRVTDFLCAKPSDRPLPSTFRPGVVPTDLAKVLPEFVVLSLRRALPQFDRSMPGFVSAEAQFVGVETRTSSPVRIVRDRGFQSPTLPGLFPVGEGAGYAGGIVSAAVDGLRAADAVVSYLNG